MESAGKGPKFAYARGDIRHPPQGQSGAPIVASHWESPVGAEYPSSRATAGMSGCMTVVMANGLPSVGEWR